MAPLDLWVRAGGPLEPLLANYRARFEEWAALGVRGLVVGRLPHPLERVDDLRRALDAARQRGWSVYIFEPAGLSGRSAEMTASVALDPRRQQAYLTRFEAVMSQLPEADGAIMDHPEWGYEIDPSHRSYLFADLPEAFVPAIEALGYDFRRMASARDRLFERLHRLTPALVAACADAGTLGGWELLGADPDLAAWLAFRQETLLTWFRRVREAADRLSREQHRPVRLGLNPRLPSLARLAGHSLPELGRVLDLLLPKLYVWNRGVDGLYGTVRNYVRVLLAWNPGLSERDAFAVVDAIFGLQLPAVERLLDLELGFPPEFFSQVIGRECRMALAAVSGAAERIVPWVDAGLRPHGGDPVPSGDLYRLLSAAHDTGIRRFIYHGAEHMTEAEREVIGALCGRRRQAVPGLP